MITGQNNRLGMLGAPVAACLVVTCVVAQTGADTHGASASGPRNEPSAKITVESPTAEGLERGAAVVHYRSENLRIAPLFGPAALSLSQRVGHVHVNVDDAPWVWAHTSQEPVTIVGLSPGPHRVRLQLMTANHQWLDEGAVSFTVPETSRNPPAARRTGQAAVQSSRQRVAARLVMDSPLPEPLARGVVFIRYRTENSGVPGDIRVRVDNTPWHWTDKAERPIIVQGLAPGPHEILIELADSSDRVIADGAVDVMIPALKSSTEVR